MATTIATISLESSDLLSSPLSFTSTTALTTAGTATGVTLTSGLARKTTSAASAAAIQAVNLYRAADYIFNMTAFSPKAITWTSTFHATSSTHFNLIFIISSRA